MATAGILSILMLLMLIGSVVIGIILIVTSRRGGLGYPACGSCKYDLSGTIGSGTRCPECGAEIAVAGIIPPKGRRSVGLVWVGVALIAIPSTCFGLAFLGTVRTVRSVQSQRAAQIAATQAAAAAATATAPKSDPNVTADDSSSQTQPITSEQR